MSYIKRQLCIDFNDVTLSRNDCKEALVLLTTQYLKGGVVLIGYGPNFCIVMEIQPCRHKGLFKRLAFAINGNSVILDNRNFERIAVSENPAGSNF